MGWTTGLKECVLNSRITFFPSLWSAPIKGSVVKTMKLGVAIGLFDASFSFSQEIPNTVALKLSGRLNSDVVLLTKFIEEKHYVKNTLLGKVFILEKLIEMKHSLNRIFKT